MHVLSTPPAFVLSQDQTLQKKPIKTNHTPTQTTKKATKISTQPIPTSPENQSRPNNQKPTPPPSASHNTPQPLHSQKTPQPTKRNKASQKPKTKQKWHKKQTHYRDLKQHTHKQNRQMKNLSADHSRRLEYFRQVIFSWSNPECVIPISQEVPTIGSNARHRARTIPAGSPTPPSTP